MEFLDINKKDEFFMEIALNQAEIAMKKNEVPVGCVIVKKNIVISKAYNNIEKKNDPLAHAEIIAIKKASKKLKSWRLDKCTIYITMEPCLMCAGAILNAQIDKVVYASKNSKTGVLGSLINVYHLDIAKKIPKIKSGILEEKSEVLLKTFFKNIRK